MWPAAKQRLRALTPAGVGGSPESRMRPTVTGHSRPLASGAPARAQSSALQPGVGTEATTDSGTHRLTVVPELGRDVSCRTPPKSEARS